MVLTRKKSPRHWGNGKVPYARCKCAACSPWRNLWRKNLNLDKLENALEDCLARIHLEGEGLEECVAHYPELSKELRPLLLAAKEVQAIGRLKASPEFKARTRAALGARLRACTRRAPMWRNSPAAR